VSEHAKLSASGSKKWIACTPSARLEEQFPDEESTYAAEGTYMHALFEQAILHYLGKPVQPIHPKDHEKFHTEELQEAVDAAVKFAIERIEYARSVCKDPIILAEQRLDFSRWVPEGFGTADLIIVTDTYVEVGDLKGGKGLLVDVKGNSQFRLYMLGALHTYGHLYDVKTVIGTVLQPRLNNWGSEEMAVEELLAWAEEVVVPAAEAAWAGTGAFTPGEHCSDGFCRARFTCAARGKASLALAQADFALTEPELLSEEQILAVLTKGTEVAKWISDVQGFALKAATAHGRVFPNFKLVEGRSNRKYADQDAVASKLVAAGIPEAVIYERSLLGITEMEKAIGKKKFTELLDGLIVKPAGSPALVPVDDKREAINSTASAISDFS
jgi:hypothetical protein